MMRRAAAVAVGVGLLLSNPPAHAQGADWQFAGYLYGYFPTLDGKTTFPPATGGGSSVSVDAGTLLDNLKFVFMGALEARKGAWGGLLDTMYLDLGDTRTVTRGFSIAGRPLPGGVEAHASFDIKAWASTLTGTYRVVSTPSTTFDVLAGARYLDLKQTIDWDLSGNVGQIPIRDRSGGSIAKIENLDGVIGMRGRVTFGSDHRWFAGYYIDVGTGDSDLTWQAMGSAGYSFDWGDLVLVWRYLDYRFKSGRAIEELSLNGPALAAVFRW